MTSQSLVKHLLTEGNKLILSWFSPLQDQGGYALAVNYDIVFQPIKETIRSYFSGTLPDITTAPIWHLPILAVNDGLEAFLASVALPQDINNWMVLFTMIYIASAIALYQFELGDTALI
ncbi:hypothetical protein EV361DRAFT_1010556 [Lentinula raphanica]|uniref:Man(5)GlcNAc(2)-PP-dolichol translocation protein RFT1 n=1 Tax=Lentinula raphanica TaxID=153919 RepID=A0AA38UCW0_9AGAR|nr:hypothetical protein F5878DRAFT_652920 [Lentinula raphanica]KAJ3967004.1 hypothetical protein EV361DRAFT_1010556 [Lentinula raphanica]